MGLGLRVSASGLRVEGTRLRVHCWPLRRVLPGPPEVL